MNTTEQKYYTSTILISNGEYETLTNYCLVASGRNSAKKEVVETFDIGGDDWEQQAEIYSLVEVTAEEHAVLNKYI